MKAVFYKYVQIFASSKRLNFAENLQKIREFRPLVREKC
ncbi:hypothetical protein X781_14810 [Mannheimia sp. USDA-ARS-USMARC-1261]|nr:hypothetical protein X781_14810 [Mannheimia sp. USDA-ARS-USMARC-1261]